MNKKSIIILIATAAFLIAAIAGFYVYADKALDYKDTAPEYKKEYRWAYRYGFKVKILSVDYSEKSGTATAEIEVLKNYNYRGKARKNHALLNLFYFSMAENTGKIFADDRQGFRFVFLIRGESRF